MTAFPGVFLSPDAGGAAATADAGVSPDAGGEPTWHSEHAYFQKNPDQVERFAKFKGVDDVFGSYAELESRQGKPFHFPKDPAKLTKEQRAEMRAEIARVNNVPDGPDGYEFDLPKDLHMDEETLADYRKLAHDRGIDPDTAKDLLGLQFGMVRKLNARREQVLQGMTDNNYKTFLKEDCGGDKDVAAERLELVKQYLQSQFTKDGQIDTEGWEAFAARVYHGDRIIELPLLRALHEAAQMKMGTGGAPGDFGRQMAGTGVFDYPEMGKK